MSLKKDGYKFIFVGDVDVGKTSIIRRFTENTFVEEARTTIPCDLASKTITLDNGAGDVSLHLWDTAGQEAFKSLTASSFRGAHAVVMVYDTTDEETFEALDYWFKFVGKYCGKGVVVFILGNKCDLHDQRKVPLDRAKETYGDKVFFVMETSAKENTRVQEAFQSMGAELKKRLPNPGKATAEVVNLQAVRPQRPPDGGCC
eukprot:m.155718 g.155718  ORF g.155718 m.155718 type:complete len:202 (-) comp17540_c0_seq4:428-1033(-)